MKQESGFTLIEMLVSLTVLGIIIGAGINVFTSVSQASDKARLLEQLRYEGLRILDQVEREVKQAKNVEIVSTNGGSNNALRISSDREGSMCIQYNYFQGTTSVNGYLTRCSGSCGSFGVSIDPLTCPKFSDDSHDSGYDIHSISFSIVSPSNRPKEVYTELVLGQNRLIVSRKTGPTAMETNTMKITSTVSLRSY